jgi:heat shock protein HslJ
MASGHREPSFFKDVAGKEWQLMNLSTISGQGFNRRALEAEGMEDAYTLYFDDQRLYGKAAPNRYFAAYTVEEGQGITIKPQAATLMLSFTEPPGLREGEYFALLEKVYRWNCSPGGLELYTIDPEGQEGTLIFSAR